MILRFSILLLLLAAKCSGVILPVEVTYPSGTVKRVSINLKAGTSSKAVKLWAQIHGLRADNAAVQVGTGPWVVLSNATADVQGLGKVYGGIGGAFRTVKLTIPVTPGSLKDGPNYLYFRFVKVVSNTTGVRVVKFNLLDAAGGNLIQANQFVQENPANWKPPLTNAADIAEGLRLWRTALINSPQSPTMKAKCSTCHTQNGADLKYFAYSNLTIQSRARFHGLTATQGKQIASYIRTVNTPSPGRPWNPPFQPGPGLDSKPWAAGAGLQWVLDDDLQTLDHISDYSATSKLNVRQVPIAMQLPDWNSWLPSYAPEDSWGSAWTDSEIVSRYEALRGRFSDAVGLNAYLASPVSKSDINTWQGRLREFLRPRTEGTSVPWSSEYAEKVYSTSQWQLVKMFEMMQEFGLESYGGVYFGPAAEFRTFFDRIAFTTSPFQLGPIPPEFGIGGSELTNEFLSNAWYQVQLILNPGNGTAQGTTPIDWAYVWGHFKDLWQLSEYGELGRYALYFVKGMQEQVTPAGLDQNAGWNPYKKATIDWPMTPTPIKQWLGVPPTKKAEAFDKLLTAWLVQCNRFPPTEYWAKGYADPLAVPTANYLGSWGDRLLYAIPQFTAIGVPKATVDKLSLFGSRIYPAGAWPGIATDTPGGLGP